MTRFLDIQVSFGVSPIYTKIAIDKTFEYLSCLQQELFDYLKYVDTAVLEIFIDFFYLFIFLWNYNFSTGVISPVETLYFQTKKT